MSKRPSVIGGLKLNAAKPVEELAPPPLASRKPRPDIVHTSIYLPKAVHRALREIAFTTDRKVHDLVLDGLNRVLQEHGKPSVAELTDSAKA